MMQKKKKAMHWSLKNNHVVCSLCSHTCRIEDGKRGLCGVREAKGGELYTLIYGRASSIAVDPIEKKPLYHYKPGSKVLSLGTVGCNFRCLHCQNNDIACSSPESPFLRNITSKQVVEMTRDRECTGIAWTYNEPTIWYEFTLETSKLAKEQGLATMYVTNGYMKAEALREHAPYLDAMNIDVKGFTQEFYKKVVGAKLEPVLESCKLAKELGIHIEITYLIIPDHNDTPRELQEFSAWVVNQLGADTPVHFSRFHPHHKMRHLPPTPLTTLETAYKTAKEQGIQHVYLGNIPGDKRENTHCHKCNTLCIQRTGFRLTNNTTKHGKCPECGEKLPLINST